MIQDSLDLEFVATWTPIADLVVVNTSHLTMLNLLFIAMMPNF